MAGFNNPPLQYVANTKDFREGPKGAPENNWIRVNTLENNTMIPFPQLPNTSKIMNLLNNQIELIGMNKVKPRAAMLKIKPKIQSLLND